MRKRNARAHAPLIAAAVGAALPILIHAYLRVTAHEAWPASLFVVLPPWCWLVLPLGLLLWAALARNAAAVGLSLAALALAAALLGGMCWARGSAGTAAPEARSVRVVTWNVHGDEGDDPSAEVRRAVERLAPDILCLQEATGKAKWGNLLPGWYDVSVDDLRIKSRHPIPEFRRLVIAADSPRGAMAATVCAPWGEVEVVNVHFRGVRFGSQDPFPPLSGLPSRLATGVHLRREQADGLLAALPEAGPMIVCGDFNFPPTSNSYSALRESLTDTFAATSYGFGLTYAVHARVPAWRIDYVWCGAGVRPLRCRLGAWGISDHRPVIADFLVETLGGTGR